MRLGKSVHTLFGGVAILATVASACGGAAAPTATARPAGTQAPQPTATRSAAPTQIPVQQTAAPQATPTAVVSAKPEGQIIVSGAFALKQNDPQKNPGNERSYTQNVFEGLLLRASKGAQLIPALATKWQANAAATEWTFTIRKDATWHDGKPVTAQDVGFSFDRIVTDEVINSGSYMGPAIKSDYASTEIVDASTVKVKMKQPSPVFISNLDAYFLLVPKHAIEADARAWAAKPIGHGSFKFVSRLVDVETVMEAYEGHYARVPSVKRVTLREIADPQTSLAALRAGQVDMTSIPLTAVETIKKDPNIQMIGVPTTVVWWVQFTPWMKPFDDVRVRQAVNYAMNKDRLIDGIMQGRAFITPTASSPVVEGFDPNLKAYAYDPAKAKQLLAAAGFPNGFDAGKFQVSPAQIDAQALDVTQAIIADLAAVGIKSEIQVTEGGAHTSAYVGRGLGPMAIANTASSNYNGEATLRRHFRTGGSISYYPGKCKDATCSAAGDVGKPGYNIFDDIVDRVQGVTDLGEREKALRAAYQKIYDEAAVGFLFGTRLTFGLGPRVAEWKGLDGSTDWRYLDTVKLKK